MGRGGVRPAHGLPPVEATGQLCVRPVAKVEVIVSLSRSVGISQGGFSGCKPHITP